MFVAIVTAPRWPASLMTSASRSCCFALSTWCGIPRCVSLLESISEISTEMVPTSTGWPRSWVSAMSSTTAFHFASRVLKMRSFWSSRTIGRFVGIDTTSIL